MNYITSLFAAFTAYTHSNPVIAGVMSLWGLSAATILFRKFPAKIFTWIYSQITSTLEFDDTEIGWTRENYAAFMQWYMHRKELSFTRHFSVVSTGAPLEARMEEGFAAAVGVGSGMHYFFYKGRLCKMQRRMLEKQGHNNVHQIVITVFSRNKKLIYEMLDEFCHKVDVEKMRLFGFGSNSGYWASIMSLRKRPLKSVMAAGDLKNKLLKDVEDFLANKQWYHDRGLPHKKTFILHGKPGGGKTSLVKSVAAHFNMNLARINLNDMTDHSLEQALATVPKRTVVLVEDFDSVDAVKMRNSLKSELRRKAKEKGEEEENKDSVKLMDFDRLTLSGILNALDGVVELDGTIIFMTTNVLNEIDPALTRKGRVDKIYEVTALTHREVVEYIELMFPNVFLDNELIFNDIMGCDLQAIYFDHADNVHDFVDAIPSNRTEFNQKLKAGLQLEAA